jgi:hypothetical protein
MAMRRTSSARSHGCPSISRPVLISQPYQMPVKMPKTINSPQNSVR